MNWPSEAGEDSGGWPSTLVRRLVCPVAWAAREMREDLGDLGLNSGIEEPSYVLDLKLVLGFRNTE